MEPHRDKRKTETQKLKDEEEEDNDDFLALSLFSSSSSSSHSLPQPNSSSSPALSLSLQSTRLPSSFSSSSNPDLQCSCPRQNLPYPVTLSAPPSSTRPSIFPNPQQLATEPAAPLLPTTKPRSSLSPNPSQRPGPLNLQPAHIPPNPNHRGPRGFAKSVIIPAPFSWATVRRAKLHSLMYLRENQIRTITGMVHCKTCESNYEMSFDLEAKFKEVSTFIYTNDMHNRAPPVWMNPILPICRNCGNSTVRPLIEKKRSINWLFLFLGQMLGCCTLEQLKYYCKHVGVFRTGAKDRILYITYIGILNQLKPGGDLYIP